jgi:uncharacterized protein (DUF433 family)
MKRASGKNLLGVYTVSQVCRILQPTMTSRKVHYWLDTGLLSEPVVHGHTGTPTLLNFRQLLEIRTLQQLRDNLNISLQRAREAYRYVLDYLFADSWSELRFVRGVDGALVASIRTGESIVIPGGQGVWGDLLDDLNSFAQDTRTAWEARTLTIAGRPHVVSNARVQVGAPTLRGTRIETSTIASFAIRGEYDQTTVEQVSETYPQLPAVAILDALEFEGCTAAA